MGERDIRFYGSATLGPRGQVTVPATLRRELGLHPGDQVLFVREGDDPAGFQVCLPQHALRGVLPARPGEGFSPTRQAGSEDMDRKVVGERDIRFYGSATLGPRGQVTVPATLRRDLGLHPGDQVLFVREGDDPAGFQVCLPQHALRGVLPARPGERFSPTRQAGSEDMDRKVEHVRRIDLFRNLDPAVQRYVASLLREERYRRGQLIVLEGDECKALYCLVSGRAKRFKTSPDGKEQILKVLVPGDSFNEVPVLDGGPNPASTAALEDCVVYALDRAAFLQAIERVPGLAGGLIQVLSSRLRHLVDLVEGLSLRNVMARLAALLLEQAEVAGRLTQQEIGAMIGATRESVGRALHSLEAAGAITITRGRITIRDPQMLRLFR